ncbi:MAG: dihydroorotase family protein [Nitrosopumilaceae archaeon]
MTVDAVIVGSHVVLTNRIMEKNIVIDDGKIVKLTSEIPSCDVKINGNGLVSIPGAIDPHVHYGVYSSIEKAALTESRVAAIGGVTTMMRMLRLGDSYKRSLDSHLQASSTTHYVDYTIHASILQKSQVDEMKFCIEKGITSFKLYLNLGGDIGHVYMDMEPGKNILNEQQVEISQEIIEDVVTTAASLHCVVLVHAEDYQMCSCGIRKTKEKNKDGLGPWSESRPVESEIKSIRTISKIAKKVGCTLYFAHIGSQGAMNAIKEEKSNGTRIYVETCPHYLSLSYENQKGYLAKVMPPVRTNSDVAFMWGQIQSGQVDSIGTDHVANQLKMKLGGKDVWDALAGFPGLGTMLPILISEGVNRGKMSIEQLVNLTSLSTSKIFGMHPTKGTLSVGSDADITMIDLKKEQKVSSELFGGFSDYLVYEGRNMKGWPVKTLVRGKIIADDFEIIGRSGYGKFVSRPA